MEIFTGLPVKILHFYTDYFLLITNIVFALFYKTLIKLKKKKSFFF